MCAAAHTSMPRRPTLYLGRRGRRRATNIANGAAGTAEPLKYLMKHNYNPLIIAALVAASLTLAMIGAAFAQHHGDGQYLRGPELVLKH